MPELPEVESTVKRIKPEVVGRRITHVEIFWRRSIALPVEVFKRKVTGMEIQDVSRRGKHIVISIGEGFVVGHLRMSGRLFVCGVGEAVGKHTRLQLILDNRLCLRLSDIRKFARFYWIKDDSSFFQRLGPEPLSKNFTSSYFFEALKARKRMIKPLLLDQSFLAGLGNIYADESLWRAGVAPYRAANTITRAEAKRLHRAIRQVLRDAIAALGTDFGDGVIVGGDYKPRAYGRQGRRCKRPRCKGVIQKITLAQRGTSFCPACQQ